MMKIWLIQLFRRASWAPALVFIFYVVAANGFHLYLKYPNLDIPTHFAGGLAITYFYLTAIRYSQPLIGAIPNIIQTILAISLTALTAVMWEFLEKLSDLLFDTKLNLGENDILSDLLMGLIGAIVMTFAAWFYGKKNELK